MKSWRVFLATSSAFALSAIAVVGPTASAMAVVDQQFVPPPIDTFAEVDDSIDHAQTFTVGLAGELVRVDCLICRSPTTRQDLLVDI